MRIKPRHMQKYTPRRRKSSKELLKQQLQDFKHLLEMDLNSFLILTEEGTAKQAEKARVKLRRDVLKHGKEMESTARDLGEGFPNLVGEFIKNMHIILQNSGTKIDSALLNAQRHNSQEIVENIKRLSAA